MNYFLKKKKWLAWVIMLTFLFTSILPSNIMAGNSVAEAAPGTDGTVAGQIELNPDEQVFKDEDGKEEVKIQKSIEAGSNENEFKITLKVSTPEKLEKIPSSADAAVVLIMDTSGSMAYGICNQTHTHNKECYDYTCGKEEHTHTWKCYSRELVCEKEEHRHSEACGQKLTCGKEEHREHTDACKVSRMANAKAAAKTFIEAYQKSANEVPGKRMLATVRFSEDASKVFDWVNVAQNGWNTNVGGYYGGTVGTKISSLGTDGGTNMAGGLQLAHNIINSAKGAGGTLAGIDNITVILLTDGCPTYHISDGEWDDTDVISGSEGGGSVASWTDQQHAKTAANNVKDISTLKVIALSTGTDSYQESKNGSYKNKDTATWLQENIGSTYRATDAESLADSFEQIGALILLGTQAWRATDPMAANIVYTGNPDGENANDDDKTGNSYTWDVDTKTINWNLKSSYPVKSHEQADGTTWYTYELEYPVRLDNTAAGIAFNEDLVTENLATNGTTELKYFMFSKVKENDEITINSMKTAEFEVPKVEGYAGQFRCNQNCS